MLDLTQRIVSQQRHMVDHGLGVPGCNNVTVKSLDTSALAAGLSMAAGSSTAGTVAVAVSRGVGTTEYP